MTTYTANGTQTTPTITTGVNEPGDIAIDAAGKIYVPNFHCDRSDCFGDVTTYNANGTQTTPTITTGSSPANVAVDAAGKIYVASGDVTTYNADGTQTTPTITGAGSTIAVH